MERGLQIPPLRCAPVGMTILLFNRICVNAATTLNESAALPFVIPNKFVIPTEALRSGGTAVPQPATLNGSAALPFVIPSEAEGSAVLSFGPNKFVIPTEA